MWTVTRCTRRGEASETGDVVKYRLNTMGYYDALFRMTAQDPDGEEFRKSLREILLEQPLSAYFWECAPCTLDSAAKDRFEFVIVPARGLSDVLPNHIAFRPNFPEDGPEFAAFPNLGRNAVLVCPSPRDPRDYAHLARFIRNAPPLVARELFVHVGHAMLARLSDKPVWLSTCGGGVSWLHVRLDDAPKYYSFTPYKQMPK